MLEVQRRLTAPIGSFWDVGVVAKNPICAMLNKHTVLLAVDHYSEFVSPNQVWEMSI